MDDLSVKFKGTAPEYKTPGAAGCDLMSSEDVVVEPGSHKVVSTGLFLEIPRGYECQVRSRSGLAANSGVFVLNSPGTIDSDYRGEVKVILFNTSKDAGFNVRKGDRIAQLVFSRVYQATFEETERLNETKRGEGGFGSTGTAG